LQASEDLQLIDPKINVRVNKNTPLSFYERCTRLTKQGLGFPQYSNDDVVIPGQVALGYDLEDARNYTVAACWEFIIPGCGADTPNITTMNFPLVIEHATEKYLPSAQTFADFLEGVKAELEAESKRQIAYGNEQVWSSDVLMSLLIRPCIERGKKMYEGAKYRNFGMHGAGISNAADALEAIERAVFVDKIVSAKELLAALKVDFVGYEDLQKQLLALCSGKCKTARPHGNGYKGMCYLRITPKHLYKPAARAKNR
jgi:formate C-acetyltransferase